MSVLPVGLVQPDARSCGAASLVAARMLLDPPYAELVTTGVHPTSGARLEGDLARRFGTEVLAMHRRVTGPAGLDGRAQVPWPRAIGTPPWAVARQLASTGGPALAPVPHTSVLVRDALQHCVPLLDSGLDGGRPVALFVGDRWLPRHVVLATARSGASTEVYDPARGRSVSVSDAAFTATRLPFGRWTHCWFVVVPH